MSIVDGAVKIDWPDDFEHRRDDRLSPKGKAVHLREIREHMAMYKPDIERAMELLKEIKDYNACELKSPIREARKAEILAKAQAKKAE